MSNDKEKASLPPEARRRGGMDTLFSAAWFDEEQAKTGNTPPGADRSASAPVPAAAGRIEEAPAKSNTMLYAVVGGVVLLLVGTLGCTGLFGALGAMYYVLGA